MAERKTYASQTLKAKQYLIDKPYLCVCCGKRFPEQERNFFKNSGSKRFKGNNGHLPICGTCLKKEYDSYRMINGEKEAVRLMCMSWDYYFSERLFEDIAAKTADPATLLSVYLRSIAMDYVPGKVYADTIEEQKQIDALANATLIREREELTADKERFYREREAFEADRLGTERLIATINQNCDAKIRAIEERHQHELEDARRLASDEAKQHIIVTMGVDDTLGVDDSMIKFFGPGLSVFDYHFLQNQYDDWIARHECQGKVQEELFKSLCFVQLDIQKNIREGRSNKDNYATFQNLLSSANLKPSQKMEGSLAEQNTFGTLIRKWEDEKPIPDPDPEWADKNNIIKYITVWFFGHLCKMMGIHNQWSEMYDEEIAQYSGEHPEYFEEDDGDGS